MRVLFTESSFIFCKIDSHRKSQQLHLSTCIQLRVTKHPSRKVMNFRHLLGCDTIVSLHELTSITDAYQWNAHDHLE